MSALPPKADIEKEAAARLLLTPRGQSIPSEETGLHAIPRCTVAGYSAYVVSATRSFEFLIPL